MRSFLVASTIYIVIYEGGFWGVYIYTQHITMVYDVTTISNGGTRETRDGWPLLSVETEVNGDSKSTN